MCFKPADTGLNTVPCCPIAQPRRYSLLAQGNSLFAKVLAKPNLMAAL